MIVREPPTTNDEQPSSVLSKSTEEVKDFDFLSISSSHGMMSVGDLEIPIIGTNMRLLTRTRHKKEEKLGINNQYLTQPLEIVQRPQFTGSRYTKGECSKVSDSSETSLKSSSKENDGKTSPSSHVSSHCKERIDASSHRHNDIRDNKGRNNHFRSSNDHFDCNRVVRDECKSWNRKTCTFYGLHNHTFSKCWKRMEAHERMRCERPSQQHENKKVK